jgi:hypothetical protein
VPAARTTCAQASIAERDEQRGLELAKRGRAAVDEPVANGDAELGLQGGQYVAKAEADQDADHEI